MGLALGGSRLILLFLAGGLDLLGLFRSQQKLIFRQRLSATAEAVPLQFLDDLDQASILDVARQDHSFQRIQISTNVSIDGGLSFFHRVGNSPAHADAEWTPAAELSRENSRYGYHLSESYKQYCESALLKKHGRVGKYF